MSFFQIFKLTIPVLMGYVPTGMAFGLLAASYLIPWHYIFFMSVFIYAGAGQFLAASMFFIHASFYEIAVATFLLNLRHSFYGLSMIRPFENMKKSKLYLIFGLTDETFALMQTIPKIENQKERKKAYVLITILNQSYWIIGTLIGVFIGNSIKINYEGIEFALTALFVVLAIELYKKYPNPKSLMLSLMIGLGGMVFLPSKHMLVISLCICLVFLLGLKEWLNER